MSPFRFMYLTLWKPLRRCRTGTHGTEIWLTLGCLRGTRWRRSSRLRCSLWHRERRTRYGGSRSGISPSSRRHRTICKFGKFHFSIVTLAPLTRRNLATSMAPKRTPWCPVLNSVRSIWPCYAGSRLRIWGRLWQPPPSTLRQRILYNLGRHLKLERYHFKIGSFDHDDIYSCVWFCSSSKWKNSTSLLHSPHIDKQFIQTPTGPLRALSNFISLRMIQTFFRNFFVLKTHFKETFKI